VHVLVGIDGSALAVSAAQRGIALLDQPDHLTLLTVLDKLPGDYVGDGEETFYSPDLNDPQWRSEIAATHSELERAAAVLVSTRIDQRIEAGDVARTICSVASELGVDTIIVGSHGRGGLGRLLLGSVSEHVVRHAPCPVLVVREHDSSEPPSTHAARHTRIS
jgi:nucleotide-binding universal stress UspA family protein